MLFVDQDERVLLFSGIDRTKPDLAPWWFSVGGGLDPGESVEQAAVREVHEETGLVLLDPGPVMFTRHFCWDFEGQEYDQEEFFFVVRTRRFEPTRTGWTSTEIATIRSHRWWSVDELRTTGEAVYPKNLAETLDGLLRTDVPSDRT